MQVGEAPWPRGFVIWVVFCWGFEMCGAMSALCGKDKAEGMMSRRLVGRWGSKRFVLEPTRETRGRVRASSD